MNSQPSFGAYLRRGYLLPGAAALFPAFLAARSFKPDTGEPLSEFVWLLSYLPSRIFDYWPHELGHVLAGLLWDNRMFIYISGTGLQLLLPLAFVAWALRKREMLLSWLAIFWLGYALKSVAYYMADALHPVGSYAAPFDGRMYSPADVMNTHDWRVMFGAAGLLSQSVWIAAKVYFLALWCMWLPPMILFFDFLQSVWQSLVNSEGSRNS